MAAFEQLSGIAGEIRASALSEQFDLAGFTESRAKELIQCAFSEPLDVPKEMVKFTFIVGGGKLVRSRYSDDLTKWMTNALRELGYTDDRSAAVDFSSQGTYKQQHDTGQNLKYLVVFPHVKCADQKGTDIASEAATAGPNTSSKEYIVSACELSTFKEIVASKTQSWSQRKRMLKVIQDSKNDFDALEQKLVQGSLLSPPEQALYDANSGCDQEKITWLQGEIKGMAEGGRLTKVEKVQLVESLTANLRVLEEEIAQSLTEGKGKRAEKLMEKRSAVQLRLERVQAAPPITHRLKHGDDIQRAVVELQPLYTLEEKGRAVALTIGDLRTLEAKGDLEQRIAQLEAASRCWFETDEEFAVRCDLEQEQGKAKFEATRKKLGGTKKKASGAGSGGGKPAGTQGRIATKSSASSSAGQWASIGKKKVNTSGSRPAPKTAAGGGNGFAAAFGDNDDSSDEDS